MMPMTKKNLWLMKLSMGLIGMALVATACMRVGIRHEPLAGEDDIVFQIWDGGSAKDNNIAVMRSDGTGVRTIYPETRMILPIWSADKTDVLFMMPWSMYSYFGAYGKVQSYQQGEECSIIINNRPRWYASDKLLSTQTDFIDGVQTSNNIFIYDLNSCKISKVLILDKAENGYFAEPEYSSLGELVFTRQTTKNWIVTVLELTSGQQREIAEGFGASWSPDGEQLVFTGDDGLYLADRLGEHVNRIVDMTSSLVQDEKFINWGDWPPLADWSPDGKHLIFHRRQGERYDIVVYDVEAGSETVIYQGGMYPDWR